MVFNILSYEPAYLIIKKSHHETLLCFFSPCIEINDYVDFVLQSGDVIYIFV